MEITVGKIRLFGNTSLASALRLGEEVGVHANEVIEAVLNELPPVMYVKARALGYTIEQMLEKPVLLTHPYLSARTTHSLSEEEAFELLGLTGAKSFRRKEYYRFRALGLGHRMAIECIAFSREALVIARSGTKPFRVNPFGFMRALLESDDTLDIEDIRALWYVAVGAEDVSQELTDSALAALMDAGLDFDDGEVEEQLGSRETERTTKAKS